MDFVLSVGLLVYLMRLKESITPDFFHFIMCLTGDYCHTIWILFLWFTYKAYFIKKSDTAYLSENARISVILLQGLAGLLIAQELKWSSLIIYGIASTVQIARLRYPDHMNLSLMFFIFLYLT
jgi:hypothetical protein